MGRSYLRYKINHPSTTPWMNWREYEKEWMPFFRELSDQSDAYAAHVAIIASIKNSGLADQFVANSGMIDRTLRVALVSIDPPLRESISVCGSSWNFTPPPGHVRIRHESFSGMVEDVERPIVEAVPLFWRFVAEKFGIAHCAS